MKFHVHRAPAHRERELMLILGGAGFFKVVVAAHELQLFQFLNDYPDSTPEQISKALQLPLASVRTLLMACCALHFIERSEAGVYKNVQWVDGAFAGDAPSFAAMIEGFDKLLYQPFFHLTEALRRGTNTGLDYFAGGGSTIYERLSNYPELEAVFHAWMSSLSGRGLPPRLVEALDGRRRLLDVGGGDGTNAILLARAHPALEITILDLPSVCERAQAKIAEAGLNDQIDAVPCDFRTEPFPRGYDAVLFSRIFNIYSDEQNQRFVQRSADCLGPEGLLIVYPSMVALDDETGPLSAAFLSLYYLCLATGEGRVYAPSSYERWFDKARFASVTCFVDERDEAVFVGCR